MYKCSNYNIIQDSTDTLIIYNMLTGGILSLTDRYAESFRQYCKSKDCKYLEPDLLKNLKMGNMIIPIEENECDYVEVMSNISRYSCNTLGLTIAPTTNCNFACPYCYEKDLPFVNMDHDVEENVCKFIDEQMKNRKKLSITWYGGEPLLYQESIQYISHHVLKREYNYSSQIVTNGYYLTRDVAEMLARNKITHVQITLDGAAEFHDQRRHLKDGRGTFQRILGNIKENCDLFKINIRINVDKNNMTQASDLLDVLDENGLKGKVSLYTSPVDNKIGSKCDEGICFNDKEYAEEQIKFYTNNADRGYLFINSPSFRPSICGAISCSSFIIDPKGDLYKCWDDIGVVDERIGNIENDKIMTAQHVKWLHYSVFNDDECRHCKVLPLCLGGCPNKSVKGGKRKCHPYKYNIEEYLKVLQIRAETK